MYLSRAAKVCLLVTTTALVLSAGTISLTDGAATYSASATNCTGFGGPWTGCGATGYLSSSNTMNETELFNFTGFNNPGGAGEERFIDSFNSWANGNGWTLQNGGGLDLTYSISKFRTFASSSNGGVEIQVDVTKPGGSTVDLSTLVWVQALAINYKVQDAPGVNYSPPVLAMDSFTFNLGGSAIPAGSTCDNNGADGKPYCDPAYPFQYADHKFYDKPTGLYPIDSFRGIALLANIDRGNNKLTVYDTGVNYGFDLYVTPEPGTFVMIGAGFAALVAIRRRRSSLN